MRVRAVVVVSLVSVLLYCRRIRIWDALDLLGGARGAGSAGGGGARKQICHTPPPSIAGSLDSAMALHQTEETDRQS